MRLTSPLAGLVLVVSGAVACKESTTPAPPTPTSISLSVTTVNLDALDATAPLAATVLDQNGQPMAGLAATFTSADPSIASVNGTSGVVTAVANGQTTVTASHESLSQDVAIEVAQRATQLVKTAGDGQSGAVGAQLLQGVRVELQDRLGNFVPGGAGGFVVNSVVNFSVTQGGGLVTDGTVPVGANGQASTTWTLGTVAGPQQVTASLTGGMVSAAFAATATAGSADALEMVSGNSQTAAIGTPLPDSIVVRVVDAFGNPVAGHDITFSTPDGGALSPAIVTTAANGQAASEWSLGPGVGSQGAEAQAATALTGSPVAFAATATNPVATSVAAFEGDGQFGLVGYAINVPAAVIVRDQAGGPFAGATVTFMVASGGGSLTGGAAVTDANGIARVGSWTLGGSAGANTLTATVTGSSISGNPVTFTATGETASYGIVITYQPGTNPTAAQQTAFNDAVAFWQTIIFRDQVDVAVNADASACGIGVVNKTIDDIEIFVTFADIDGPGATLAQAGRCDTDPPTLRTSNGLPVLGVMTMDNADLATLEGNGTLQATVRHEMGHALGYDARMFAFKNRLQNPSLPSSPGVDTHFSGPQAVAEMNASGGAGYAGLKVPLENTAMAGQADSHWRESVFDEELMTPFVEAGGVAMPFSRVTAAAMLDLGYGVNLAGAEAFALGAPPGLAGARAPRVKIPLGADVVFYRITVGTGSEVRR